VKHALPSGATMSVKDVYHKNGLKHAVPPPGEECLHYLARDQINKDGGVKIYRVCFKDGKLSEKTTLLSTS
jgi:hypothetical protein